MLFSPFRSVFPAPGGVYPAPIPRAACMMRDAVDGVAPLWLTYQQRWQLHLTHDNGFCPETLQQALLPEPLRGKHAPTPCSAAGCCARRGGSARPVPVYDNNHCKNQASCSLVWRHRTQRRQNSPQRGKRRAPGGILPSCRSLSLTCLTSIKVSHSFARHPSALPSASQEHPPGPLPWHGQANTPARLRLTRPPCARYRHAEHAQNHAAFRHEQAIAGKPRTPGGCRQPEKTYSLKII